MSQSGSDDLIPVNDPSEIPAFATEAEEAEFWATHEISDELWDKLPDGRAGLPHPRESGSDA